MPPTLSVKASSAHTSHLDYRLGENAVKVNKMAFLLFGHDTRALHKPTT
jgi:hypothetical protein